MSIGNGAWQTDLRIGKQASAGTVAGTMYSLDMEDSGGLSKGQTYIDRRPAYGGRTATSGMHKSDVYFPGGAMPSWAVGIDANARELLMLLEMFYQNSSFGTGGGTAPNSFTFTPMTTQPANLAATELYSVQQVTAASPDGYDEQYLDCVASQQEISWSVGNPFTIKNTIQALSSSDLNLSAPDGAAANIPILGASEIAFSLTLNGSSYTLYPDSFSMTTDNNMGDHGGAGAASRNRFTFGILSGEMTLNLPRNADLGKIRAEASDLVGTLAVALRPSTGSYVAGDGSLATDMTVYVQFPRMDFEVGGEGDLTNELAGSVLGASPAWVVYTDLTEIG